MKKLVYCTILAVATLLPACKDLQEVNNDPNNPTETSTPTLVTGAQKKMMDYVYDAWAGGRQTLVYAQYWSQINYTEEDRYQIRESTNNSYFNQYYLILNTLENIIELNTNPDTKTKVSAYGDNNNQIAAARIMKVWLYQYIADTWGDVPYSEALKLKEGVISPKYDNLTAIYADLIKELTEASSQIDVSKKAFTDGDIICGGSAAKWKKLANSLKARLAIRVSKVDTNWKQYIDEAVAAGVMTSNDDNAVYKYSTTSPNECYFYRSWQVDGRDDFFACKTIIDIMKGQPDTLNAKSHPWEGVEDPRLKIFSTPTEDGEFFGWAYGIQSGMQPDLLFEQCPSWYDYPAPILNADFSVQMMTYAELCFILSERNDFDADWYEKGIRASIEYWNSIDPKVSVSAVDEEAYVQAVLAAAPANAETVALQKYIHLYTNGAEAWAEYRRTGYPEQILRPGENGYFDGADDYVFEPLEETKGDLPARVKYPTNESTVNKTSFDAAVAKLQDGTNNYYSKMFWDVRTGPYSHPANK